MPIERRQTTAENGCSTGADGCIKARMKWSYTEDVLRRFAGMGVYIGACGEVMTMGVQTNIKRSDGVSPHESDS